MKRLPHRLFLVCIALTISSCASLDPAYETPAVSITSFEAVPAQGILPAFDIGLHIVNPNRSALELKGLAYTILIEGHKIITGVSNNLPAIEPYDSADVRITGSMDVLNSIGFITDLIQNQRRETVSFQLDVKLDPGGIYPAIRTQKKGKISLSAK